MIASDVLPVDISYDDGLVRVELDVPGVRPGLDVHARGHTVTVRGTRRAGTGTYLVRQRNAEIVREIELPPEADMLNVRACTHDGVLLIVAPLGQGRSEPGERRLEVLPSTFACHPDAAPI